MSTETLTKGWIPDTTTFAARLALIRREMRWNLKEASAECGLPSMNSWGNWEAGSMPRNYMDAVDLIVKRTRVNRMWLMMGEGSPSDYKSPVVDLHKEREKRSSSLTRPAGRSGNTGPKKRAA
jgi:hypothetical protein